MRSPNMVSKCHFWTTHAEEQQSIVARTSMKDTELGLLVEHHVYSNLEMPMIMNKKEGQSAQFSYYYN